MSITGAVNNFQTGLCQVAHDLNDISHKIQDTVDEQTKKLFDIISTESGAFQNKLSGAISEAQGKMSEAMTQFEDWITTTPPAGWTTDAMNEIKTATQSLQTSVTGFMNHTDILSGKNLFPTGVDDIPSLSTIMSVGHQSVALNHMLDRVAGNPCGSLLNMFSSCLCGGSFMQDINDLYQDIIGAIEDVSTSKEILLGKIQEFKANLDNSVLFDKNTFKGLVADLERMALSQMLGDFYNHPCGRWILQNSIGNKTLLDELQK